MVCDACVQAGPNVPTENASVAEVVEWQTRTFEGRVAQAVRVQVPPSAPNIQQARHTHREGTHRVPT